MIMPSKGALLRWCFAMDDLVNNGTFARTDEEIVDGVQQMLTLFWETYELNINPEEDGS